MISESIETDAAADAVDSPPGSTLAEMVLGYEPVVDIKRRIKMMRVRAQALPGRALPNYASVYRDIEATLPEGTKPVLLSVESSDFSSTVRKCSANPNLLIEVPVELVQDVHGHHMISVLRQARFRLVLRGEVPDSLPPTVRSAFVYNMVDASADILHCVPFKPAPTNLLGSSQQRRIPQAILGISKLAQMNSAFERGATSCVGWPFDDAIQWPRQSTVIPSFATISELITRLNRGDDVAALETVIRQDAALAYRLLQLINSAAYGLRIEVTSFRHCVMMLGYEKLKRWLSLVLSTSSRDATMQPIMFASFLRGAILEKLVSGSEQEQTRDELFTLGVFSLIDHIFGKPLDQLLETLQFAPDIRSALLGQEGPYAPYLRLVRALEQGEPSDLIARLDEAFISLRECNECLLRTLGNPGFPSESDAAL